MSSNETQPHVLDNNNNSKPVFPTRLPVHHSVFSPDSTQNLSSLLLDTPVPDSTQIPQEQPIITHKAPPGLIDLENTLKRSLENPNPTNSGQGKPKDQSTQPKKGKKHGHNDHKTKHVLSHIPDSGCLRLSRDESSESAVVSADNSETHKKNSKKGKQSQKSQKKKDKEMRHIADEHPSPPPGRDPLPMPYHLPYGKPSRSSSSLPHPSSSSNLQRMLRLSPGTLDTQNRTDHHQQQKYQYRYRSSGEPTTRAPLSTAYHTASIDGLGTPSSRASGDMAIPPRRGTSPPRPDEDRPVDDSELKDFDQFTKYSKQMQKNRKKMFKVAKRAEKMTRRELPDGGLSHSTPTSGVPAGAGIPISPIPGAKGIPAYPSQYSRHGHHGDDGGEQPYSSQYHSQLHNDPYYHQSQSSSYHQQHNSHPMQTANGSAPHKHMESLQPGQDGGKDLPLDHPLTIEYLASLQKASTQAQSIEFKSLKDYEAFQQKYSNYQALLHDHHAHKIHEMDAMQAKAQHHHRAANEGGLHHHHPLHPHPLPNSHLIRSRGGGGIHEGDEDDEHFNSTKSRPSSSSIALHNSTPFSSAGYNATPEPLRFQKSSTPPPSQAPQMSSSARLHQFTLHNHHNGHHHHQPSTHYNDPRLAGLNPVPTALLPPTTISPTSTDLTTGGPSTSYTPHSVPLRPRYRKDPPPRGDDNDSLEDSAKLSPLPPPTVEQSSSQQHPVDGYQLDSSSSDYHSSHPAAGGGGPGIMAFQNTNANSNLNEHQRRFQPQPTVTSPPQPPYLSPTSPNSHDLPYVSTLTTAAGASMIPLPHPQQFLAHTSSLATSAGQYTTSKTIHPNRLATTANTTARGTPNKRTITAQQQHQQNQGQLHTTHPSTLGSVGITQQNAPTDSLTSSTPDPKASQDVDDKDASDSKDQGDSSLDQTIYPPGADPETGDHSELELDSDERSDRPRDGHGRDGCHGQSDEDEDDADNDEDDDDSDSESDELPDFFTYSGLRPDCHVHNYSRDLLLHDDIGTVDAKHLLDRNGSKHSHVVDAQLSRDPSGISASTTHEQFLELLKVKQHLPDPQDRQAVDDNAVVTHPFQSTPHRLALMHHGSSPPHQNSSSPTHGLHHDILIPPISSHSKEIDPLYGYLEGSDDDDHDFDSDGSDLRSAHLSHDSNDGLYRPKLKKKKGGKHKGKELDKKKLKKLKDKMKKRLLLSDGIGVGLDPNDYQNMSNSGDRFTDSSSFSSDASLGKKKKGKKNKGKGKGKGKGKDKSKEKQDQEAKRAEPVLLPGQINITQHLSKVKAKKAYERELTKLQEELVKLQAWIKYKGLKVVVLFEGRDAAGKGGVIKRITERLNPRICRVCALGTPTEREKTQWYFQRYIAQLPAAGEMVLFDRSWYNRAGVERVMGFCTDEMYWEFMHSCPIFEEMLVRSGIILLKYWFSVSDEIQEQRFQERMHNPTKRWKLSPMDVESRNKWVEYSNAKDDMIKFTDTEMCSWFHVPADNKKLARLNCIAHLLSSIPYQDLTPPPTILPPREFSHIYVRPPVSTTHVVQNKYI